MSAAPLDVCLLGPRRYVQGTQMIARACEALGATVDLAGAVLDQVRFVRLTDRLVEVARDAAPDDAAAIGSVAVRQRGESIHVHLRERAEVAPRRELPASLVLDGFEHGGPLAGAWAFRAAPGLEGVLDALVQGTKRLHEALVPPVADIWFTSLRGLALPLAWPGFDGHGRIAVAPLRRLADAGRVQTLLKVTVSAAVLAQPLEGLITFAFRQGGADVA